MGEMHIYECFNCKKTVSIVYQNAYFLSLLANKDIEKQIEEQNLTNVLDFMKTFPEGRLDKRKQVYICPKCNSFRNEYDLSMYIPKPNEELKESLIPNTNSGYEVFQKNEHICSFCNIEMEKMIKHNSKYVYLCPYCNTPMEWNSVELFKG